MTGAPATPLIEMSGVTKHFPRRRGIFQAAQVVRAVDGVSLRVASAETLGIVGESGCGKSTVARLLLKLEEPTSGAIRFDGQPLASLTGKALLQYRRAVQAVFQDPFSSLSPRMRIGSILSEAFDVHRIGDRGANRARILEMLALVGLPGAAVDRYPHEFSGGQRQRIAIAKSLILNPRLVVLDEPVSALDVSIRAQILNLLVDLKQRLRVAYVFIAHDLPAVATLSDRIAVMYLGRVVETGPAAEVAARPQHPYTRMLFSAVLSPLDPKPANTIQPRGEPASPISPPSGCHFHPRCPHAMARCRTETPAARPAGQSLVTCHLFEPGPGGSDAEVTAPDVLALGKLSG